MLEQMLEQVMATPLWKFLNSNFVILALGSGIGFAIVELLWEPLKARQADRARRESCRAEARFRLFNFPQKEFIGRKAELSGGMGASRLNADYQNWSLQGLVYGGWDHQMMQRCLPLIKGLEDETQKLLDEEPRDLYRLDRKKSFDELENLLSK